MATVQIRNLDDRAYAVLRERAAASGRSLQEYLRISLEQQAAEPEIAEALDRARAHLSWANGPTMEDILRVQRAGRAR